MDESPRESESETRPGALEQFSLRSLVITVFVYAFWLLALVGEEFPARRGLGLAVLIVALLFTAVAVFKQTWNYFLLIGIFWTAVILSSALAGWIR